MEFKWIEGEDLNRLLSIFNQYGWTSLDPVFSKALIAEEDGEIIGFNVLQVVLRPEPLWVKPERRGRKEDIAMNLAKKMDTHLRDSGAKYWEIKTNSPFVQRICKENGMKEIEDTMLAGDN